MKCSQLKIKAMESKSKNDVIKYKKQHNIVVKLKKRCKKGFFDNFETNNISKPFWSTSKQYFSNKHAKGYVDILLIENNKLLLDNRKVMKLLFNNYFPSITKNLDLFEWPNESKFNIFDEIDIIINKFWSHPKIIKLKQKFPMKRKLAFKPFAEEFFKNIVNDLSWNEAAGGDIPLNLIKESIFILPYLAHCVNEDLVKSEFPDPLKLSNVVPVQKKEDFTDKTNYRPVSVS